MNQLTTFTSTPQGAAAYLKTLPAIRERCSRVHDLAKQGKLEYFDYAPDKEDQVAEFCVNIIKRDFGSNYQSIPPHGRWRHFDIDKPRIDELLTNWSDSISDLEVCKRLIDLFLVSVLLDAGAGSIWSYHEEDGGVYSRSEGLAIASLAMFKQGIFSSDSTQPYKVDAEGLSKLSVERIAAAMQVNESNPMAGIDGRATLISNLSKALRTNTTFFGPDGRPGNIIDYLRSQSLSSEFSELNARIDVSSLWTVLIEGLAPIWPQSRVEVGGISLGDVWLCNALKNQANLDDDNVTSLVPFHKLSQWLAYSLIEPLERILHWKIDGLDFLTGLPEYRNGGLLVDFDVLTLRPGSINISFYPPSSQIPRLSPAHPAIVEWRAMTVIELDRVANLIRKKLNAPDLSLPQILESATWKGGREIAKVKRPATGGPPIDIISDGTVF
ncbi:hypothetical protein Clacol_008861 [Clathrus columnatus]|uniref:Uracil catabolism protein 4 n=1 Tax=Clathrus columnatus TaxID=1419009 RepID=A0AAV5AJN5_9AGAM|nr:hypothetical protein Clacol_008861 [Clathrus columnatus]